MAKEGTMDETETVDRPSSPDSQLDSQLDSQRDASNETGAKDPLLATEPAPGANVASSAGNEPQQLNDSDWLMMGVGLSVGTALLLFVAFMVFMNVLLTAEWLLVTMWWFYVPFGVARMLKLHHDIDRNRYPRLTNLNLWKTFEDDKTCYSVLAVCAAVSVFEFVSYVVFSPGPMANGVVIACGGFVKAHVLLVFVSRRAYVNLVRLKTMRPGAIRNAEIAKVLLVVAPAAIDCTLSVVKDRRVLISAVSGIIIHHYLLAFLVVALAQYGLWLRTQDIHEVVARWKRQLDTAVRTARHSPAAQNATTRAASIYRSVVTAMANSSENRPSSAPAAAAAAAAATDTSAPSVVAV